MSGPGCQPFEGQPIQTKPVGFWCSDGTSACRLAKANGIRQTAKRVSKQNAPRIRCVLIVELILAFTLLALRCVNTFYSERIKAVKIFPPLWNAISAFSFCGLYDI